MYVRIGRQGIFFRRFVPSRGWLEERPPGGPFVRDCCFRTSRKDTSDPKKKDTSDPKKKDTGDPPSAVGFRVLGLGFWGVRV